jgi:hypothetical protein
VSRPPWPGSRAAGPAAASIAATGAGRPAEHATGPTAGAGIAHVPATPKLPTGKPHRTVSIVIDYAKRTWSKTTYSFGSASDGRRPGPQPVTALQQAAQLRAEVKAGQARLVGRETVDGQRALHLTERLPNGQVDLWVNPGTYLPIREIGTAPGMSQTSDQAIRDDYRWLPSTPANLRLLTPAGAIPAGFTQTSP